METFVPICRMTSEEFIQAIDAYASAAGIAPATVTRRAVGNSRLYMRMANGGSCSLATAGRVCSYMKANPPHQAEVDTGADLSSPKEDAA